jgi:tRNA modification GTPase
VPFSPTDTIVALATAPAPAGIGVVRISGPQALAVARAILTVPHDLEPRHATLTHVRAAQQHDANTRVPSPEPRIPSIDEVVATFFPAPPAFAGESETGGYGAATPRRAIDEVVATFFQAPHSYTAEDVVEIGAHGSLALLREIVRAAIAAGARLAEPGEFTLRAFLNGRLDLVQAEAVADLVDAVTPLQARVAFDQLDGTLTRAIAALDERLFDLAARLEASVDFPEEGYHFVARGEASETLVRVRDGIDALLATSASGRLIREGRHIAILGKPNVGKSSLFNQLVGTDRAIVAAGPGTTRDMLRETIDLDGLRLGLVDTAGIRVSEDEVEQEGVVRARKAAEAADLVVLVLDRSRPLEETDASLLRESSSAPRVVVINKTDLPAAWHAEAIGTIAAHPESWPPGVASHDPAHAGRQNAAPWFGRQHAGPHFSSAGNATPWRFHAQLEALHAPNSEAEPPPRGSWPFRGVLQTDGDRPGSRARSTQPLAPGQCGVQMHPESRTPSPGSGVVHVEAGSSDPAGSVPPNPACPERAGWDRASRREPRVPPALSEPVGTARVEGSPEMGVVHLSLKTREGLNELRAAMRAALEVSQPPRDAVMVTNVRHETLLREARESLARAIANIEQASPSTVPGTRPSTALGASEMASEELVLADITDARHALEEVTGKRTSEDVLRRIFERFCIGK